MNKQNPIKYNQANDRFRENPGSIIILIKNEQIKF
jgi:hypothetical protein